MVFSFLLRCVSTVIGAFFPAFQTFKTLARPNQRAQIYWLKYWAVFGAALAAEFVLDSLFITYLIPGYELARLIFVLYSVNPVTNGAQSLYDNLLKPLMFKHQPQIDAVKTNVTAAIMEKASGVATNVGQMLFSATVNRMAALPGIQFAGAPAMHQRTHAYNVRMEEEEEERTYPLIREIKEEPLDWEDTEGEVEILSVKQPRTRTSRRRNPSVIDVDDEEEIRMTDVDMNSGDDVEFVPAPKKAASSGRGRGRGRGKGKKN